MFWNGTYIIERSDVEEILGEEISNILYKLYADEIKTRYKELRDKKIFDTNNIINLLESWTTSVGFDNYSKEFTLYPETPSYRSSKVDKNWGIVGYKNYIENGQEVEEYKEEKQYNEGDRCFFNGVVFYAKNAIRSTAPMTGKYYNSPYELGFYNSLVRIKNWLKNRINFLDVTLKYI